MSTPISIVTVILAAMTFCSETATSAVVIGEGADSCGAWLSDRQEAKPPNVTAIAQATAREAWVMGYLSAVNLSIHGNIIGSTDMRGALAWLDSYCETRSLDDIETAVTALVLELTVRKSRN